VTIFLVILNSVAIVAGLTSIVLEVFVIRPRLLKLENEKIERINYLTDPNVIDAELERSARRREAFDSNMPYPPREDSGPSAVVRFPARSPSYRSNKLSFKRREPFGKN